VFKKTANVSGKLELVLPKPPAPPAPTNSALAAAAGGAPPPPQPTPTQVMFNLAADIDVAESNKHFNGMCLFKDDFKEIKMANCGTKFRALLEHFD